MQSKKSVLLGPCVLAMLSIAQTMVGAAEPLTEPIPLRRYDQSQIHMGTQFRVVFYAPEESLATIALQEAFSRIAKLDSELSDYRDDSELTRLSQNSGGEAVSVGDDLWSVLVRSQEISERTGGAFDITVGPAVRLWRRARRQHELPTASRIEQVLPQLGFSKIELLPQERRVRLLAEKMRLDLGGIAKGLATSEALRVLRDHGITRAMVVGGGEVALGKAPPDRQAWQIAINQPGETETARDEYLLLTDQSVSTSGDASQFVELGGKRYSHVVDPRTGWALTARRQATVVAPSGMTADALASALCVNGSDGAEGILEEFPEVSARIDEWTETGWQSWTSEGWSHIPKVKSTGSATTDERDSEATRQ